jgi:ketosteroid isomerase-like protein
MVGGDFPLGFRLGALDAKADLNDAESHEHHHFPYARRLRLGWRRDADGRWVADREDKRLWEVFCAGCSDNDGPAEN